MIKHPKKNTLCRILLQKYGEPYLRKLWQDNGGSYMAAKILSDEMGIWVTEGRFDYLAKIHGWRRCIRPDHPIALGVKFGNAKKEDYPRMIFPGDIEYEQ